ncbi:putative nepenthesin [Dioscorea sansibarensis]
MVSFLLRLLVLVFTSLISLPSSSPHEEQQQQPFLPLSHSLANSHNTTVHHLLKLSTHRSITRAQRHRRPRQVSLPLTSGSDYTLSLSLPPSPAVPLYMDTGSDLVWLPCAPFECILCETNPKPTTPPVSLPPSSRPVSCHSHLCSAAHSSLPSSDLCAIASCPLDSIETSSCSSSPCPRFYYAYGDGSLIASRHHAHVSLSSLLLPNFTFACAHSTLAEPVGVAGFGRGPLSLPAQLATLHPSLASRFSYCLVAHSFRSDRLLHLSPLILGRSSSPDSSSLTSSSSSSFVFAPLLHNPRHPYLYSVALDSISIGRSIIKSPSSLTSIDRRGNGGMAVDSGTTFTMLPTSMYSSLTDEFHRQMTANGFARAPEVEAETGLGPCYHYHGGNDTKRVPLMELHFAGNAKVALPTRNYFMGWQRERKGVGCLMVMDGGDESEGGPAGTLGNFQQQGMEVVYDLEDRRIGFARRRCAALWDSLSRGG